MNDKFLKPYNPTETESRIYKLWEESGFFNPDNCEKEGFVDASKKPFSIVMPPPNVTGVLHMGHALMLTVEDIMVRFARMQGRKTLWLPGTDHAAIATQSKVEKEISKKEGKNRFDLGREELLKRIEAFAKESHDTIVSQIKVMGSSCDWSREAFTLDEKRSQAVRTMFKKMYDDGLIYQGSRIVNWDPKGQTTISDDEIVYTEEKTKFYYFKYGPFTIGTARPETKFGDKYVVMHPDDARYANYKHGDKLTVEWINGPIEATIIKDDCIDMEFGTGVMTITPWHSNVDFEIAERHGLDKEQIIDKYGKLLPIAGEEFQGLKIKDAREKIVEKLQSKGLVEKIEDYTHNIATAERTGGIIEPQIMKQWFVAVNKKFKIKESRIENIESGSETTLKEIMTKAVQSKGVEIIPEYFNKTYFHWIDNLRDWCISRQIWYGHRIPVWYCLHCKNAEVHTKEDRTLFILRHGFTDYNKQKILQGSTDIPLNDEGREQARQAGEKLKNQNIKFIISSDLTRAKETAEIIQKITGGEIFTTDKLREKSFGDIEGVHVDEAKSRYPEINLYEGKAPNGESYKEAEERVFAELEKIIENHSGNLVIVSHGAVMRTMIRRMKNIDPKLIMEIEKIGNCEILPIDIMKNPCSKCKNNFFEQDEDTLDTWFSSGLWTFSTLGWPEETKDLKTFHPTHVLETGYEILFFWVARMILMSGYALGTVPFKTVYLHGTVRDAKGQKMSKSLGNGIDPLEIADKYGADAGRMALIYGTAPGTDSRISEDKIKGYKHFANKLWNITRFVLENTRETKFQKDFKDYTETDNKLINERNTLTAEITKEIESYMFHTASEKIYSYTWHRFADQILEESKKIFEKGTDEEKNSRKQFLLQSLENILTVLHPFMPFITEEIWQTLGKKNLLMVEKWPKI